ncbi:MAG: hypothetical protein K2X49_30100, partial [Acetobacteraceae bacterium]|nr:hypothetical protein [Acetobacteraceae bacterium]
MLMRLRGGNAAMAAWPGRPRPGASGNRLLPRPWRGACWVVLALSAAAPGLAQAPPPGGLPP